MLCLAWDWTQSAHESASALSSLQSQHFLRTVVQNKHQSGTNTSECVCDESLVHTCCYAFLRCNLLEAVERAVVHVLLLRQLGLHLQTTTNCVERIADSRASNDC